MLHKSVVLPVPHACSQLNIPGSGNDGHTFRLIKPRQHGIAVRTPALAESRVTGALYYFGCLIRLKQLSKAAIFRGIMVI